MTTTTDAVAHLTPAHWATANRQLVRKALAEFAHERLLTPNRSGATVTPYAATTRRPSTASAPGDSRSTTGRSTRLP